MSADMDSKPELHNTLYSGDARRIIETWEEESSHVTSTRQLSPVSWSILMTNAGYLAGIRVDDNSAPRRCHVPVASPKPGRRVCLQELSEVKTELTSAQHERETNYVHEGWSLLATSTLSPWAQSRIANNNQANRSVPSVTKRFLARRAQVDIALDDISPAPEFESDVRAALEKETRSEKFQALYRVFERWGDVVALAFDIGVSFTITDLESNIKNTSNKIPSMGSGELFAQQTAKVSVLGGEPNTTHEGTTIEQWLYKSVPVGQWAQIRIVKVAPVTALLSVELQTQLSQLYSSLVTHSPPSLSGDTVGGQCFDGSPHSLKTIKSVTVRCGAYVSSLRVTYLDGTSSAELGGPGVNNTFDLNTGEYISEFTVWTESKGVCALQFVTSTGRTSQCYGGGGTPTIIRGDGGVLAGFIGKVKDDIVYDLQGVWRHDIQYVEASRQITYSEYYGGAGGCSFNDLLLLKNSDSARITSIRVRCGAWINGIQLTYGNEQGGQTVISEGSYYGGGGGAEKLFSLAPNEYIVKVAGKQGVYIFQLCFTTNLGRTSETFGGDGGTEFSWRAPIAIDGKAMRLHSICGRSGKYLNGILFVWAPV